MRAALLLAAVAVLLGTTRPAAACQVTEDGRFCAKYGNAPEAPLPPSVTYVRDGRVTLPKTRAGVMRLLTTARWQPLAAADAMPLDLFDGASMGNLVDVDPAARAVMIHQVRKVHGRFQVTMDHHVFSLRTCRADHRTTLCLVPIRG
jgi:hypothetical protein